MIQKSLKKFVKFTRKNYFLLFFVIVCLLVGLVALFKLTITRSKYIYAKVKVGQGLWWASTARPNIWLINALKKNEVEKDLLGQPIAEVLSFKYYPWVGANNQYDVYLMLRLKVNVNGKTDSNIYKRSTLAVGSPIDLSFPSIQVSGTVISLSDKPLNEKYIEKIITLTKKSAYPWEYNAIHIGDKYFDGKDIVFEILDKKASDISVISTDAYGNNNQQTEEPKKYITVKAKIKVKNAEDQLIYGEDQILSLGRNIILATAKLISYDYVVATIE